MKKGSTKIKIFSLCALWFFSVLSAFATYHALQVPTDYSMEQFMPRNHPLLAWDKESKKVFHISETSPHILLLSLNSKGKEAWHDKAHLTRLGKLTTEIQSLKGVHSVVSLGNIQSAFEQKNELLVGSLIDLRQQGFKVEQVLDDPLYTPNIISKDGRHTALFVIPEKITQEQHARLLVKLKSLARKAFPAANVQVGGPAAIRTQLIDLLSREIVVFILLSLICAIAILKVMFHGYRVLGQVLFVLIIANTLAVGVMAYLGIGFNILSSTMPILVTVSSLGICTHLLVRMAEAADRSEAERITFLVELVREIFVTVALTGLSTAVGFAALIPSDVPLISEYGLVVAAAVMVTSFSTLILVPSLYVWMKWPIPRPFLAEPKRFAFFLVNRARWIVPSVLVFTAIIALIGIDLSWTARLFDDLPRNHAARRSTDMIARQLGGVASVDFTIGGDKLVDPWKNPENLRKLDHAATRIRKNKKVGSVVTLSDFMTTGSNSHLPKSKAAVSEMQFLYAMSGDSPLKQFLSGNEKWTRVAVRLPDLPANQTQIVIGEIRRELQTAFPKMQIRTSGMAAIIPQVNNQLSEKLMWGFFEALFGIIVVLALFFRSLKWALVGILPNLVPPAVLLGFLAMFNVPMKPGIAIIFSISLGIAFDNTIYILGRLKHMLKTRPASSTLPVYTLMKKETMPCLVSSLCLFAGFSIFLFSAFPVNKLFGLFVLLSILAGLLGDLVLLPALLKRYPWLLLDRAKGANIKAFPFKWQENVVKLSPYIILLALGLVAFRNAYAAPATDVKQVLKNVEQKAAPPHERVHLKMVIQESDGTKKERELSILRRNEGKEPRALIRLSKPSDLKGLSLLTVASQGKEDQWLYLPSDKKSRRILGSNKKGKFLDSEISYEDLRISTYKDFDNKVVKEDANVIQIESKAKADSDSSYGKIMTWISKPDFKIEKVDYYDKSGKLLKKAEFKNYQKVGDKFWRARQVLVHNVQDNRKTQLLVQKVNLKKISNDEVSLDALEE